MSKAVTFKCPNCEATIKTGEPIGARINVRACGICEHTYYVQAIDEKHCRVRASASVARIGYDPEKKQEEKTTFTYSRGGRSAGKAYAQANAQKDFFSTRYAERNQDIVEDAEFVILGDTYGQFTKRDPFTPEAETLEQHRDNTNVKYDTPPTRSIGVDFATGESSSANFTNPNFDREALLRGERVVAEPNRQTKQQINDKLRQFAEKLQEETDKIADRRRNKKD